MIIKLDAKTTRKARLECQARWPERLTKLTGYAAYDDLVYISFVRPLGDKAPIATATRNRSRKPIEFYATWDS